MLVCFFFMLIAAIENVVFPALLIDRSDPKNLQEYVREVYLIVGFVSLFSFANLCFLCRIYMTYHRTRPQNETQ